jgi:hypothetical protein
MGCSPLLYANDTYDRGADGNLLNRYDAAVATTGITTGTYVGAGHTTTFKDGSAVDHFKYVFTGSTPCGTGSFTNSGGGSVTADNVETGHFTTVDDSTNTARIHIDVDFVRVGGVTGTYRCL